MKSRKIYQEEEWPSYNDPPYPPDTGYLILAIAYMLPEYTCVEKACAIYYGNYKDLDRVRWVSQDIVDEMRKHKKNGMKQRKIGELFGMSESVVSRYISGKRTAIA